MASASSAAAGRVVPSQFFCPITGEMMKDPVTAADGLTYERAAITKWLSEHDTSPKTSEVLSSKELAPNHPLRQMIQENEEDRLRTAVPVNPKPQNKGTSISKLGECFKVMDKLRIVLDQSTKSWSPPSFVVFGDEDVGKSTLLNYIVGRPILPTGSGVCTRVAIAVRLRRTTDETAYMWLSKNCAVNEERPLSGVMGSVTNFFGLGGKSTQLDTKSDLAKSVRNAMNEILSTQSSVTGVCTEHFIILELNGPKYPNLDLIDLPGMTREGERKIPSERLTKMFIEQHKGRSVLLGVMAASSAPNLTTAMEIVGNLGLYSTTIGVLTKCDEVADNGLKKKVVDILDQSSSAATKLDSGYFATMLDSNNDEDGWFAKKQEVLSPILHRVGVSKLVNSMNDLFLKYIARSWIPNTLTLLMDAGKRLENDARILGLPRNPINEDAWKEIWRCVGIAIGTSPCFANLKANLNITWINTSTTNTSHLLSSASISLATLEQCATRIKADEKGLIPPWSEAYKAVTKLVTDLHGEIVKAVQVEMEKESPMQLKRFPNVINKTTNHMAKWLEKSRKDNFDGWFKEILAKFQSMEFSTPTPHEAQGEKLYERILGLMSNTVLAPPHFSDADLTETCGVQRDNLDKELADVTLAVKELERLSKVAV